MLKRVRSLFERKVQRDSPVPLDGPPPNVCYIHIYKCGGTSLRKHITDHLVTPRTTLIDQWAHDWERLVTGRDRGLGNITRAEYLRYLSRGWKHDEHIVVLTHSFFYAFMQRWSGFSFAVMLRDPVKRILSQFHFQKRTFEHCKDDELEAWLDSVSPFDFNMQTAALCGVPCSRLDPAHLQLAKANLHYFDFIGFVDDYEDSLALFNRVYGVLGQHPVRRLNANPETAEASAELLERLRERCQLDIELLEYARRLYISKMAALDMIDAGDPGVVPATITKIAADAARQTTRDTSPTAI